MMLKRVRFSVALMIVFGLIGMGTATAEEKLEPEEKLRRTPLEHFLLLSEFEISGDDLLNTRRFLMNARREVGQDFVFFPRRKFEVVLSDRETFLKYTDSPSHITGLFDGRIHIPLPSAAESESLLKSTLWHEYTHALILVLAEGRCPLWLNEGFAVYEEFRVRSPRMDLLKTFIEEENKLPFNPGQMDSVLEDVKGRDRGESQLVYQQAYCLVDFLFARYSKANIHDFLAALGRGKTVDEAMKEVFDLTPEEVERRWFSHAEKLIGSE